MDRYPEHRFVASQAQQFKWLEEQYPQLFDVIKGVGYTFSCFGTCIISLNG